VSYPEQKILSFSCFKRIALTITLATFFSPIALSREDVGSGKENAELARVISELNRQDKIRKGLIPNPCPAPHLCDAWDKLYAENLHRSIHSRTPAQKCQKEIQEARLAGLDANAILGACKEKIQSISNNPSILDATLLQWDHGKKMSVEYSESSLQSIAAADFLLGSSSSLSPSLCVDAGGLPNFGKKCTQLMGCSYPGIDSPSVKAARLEVANSQLMAWLSDREQTYQINLASMGLQHLKEGRSSELDSSMFNSLSPKAIEKREGTIRILEAAGFDFQNLPEQCGKNPDQIFNAMLKPENALIRTQAIEALTKIKTDLTLVQNQFREENPAIDPETPFAKTLLAKLYEKQRDPKFSQFNPPPHNPEVFLRNFLESENGLDKLGNPSALILDIAHQSLDVQLTNSRMRMLENLGQVRHTAACFSGDHGLPDCDSSRLVETISVVPDQFNDARSIAGDCLWKKTKINKERENLISNLGTDLLIGAVLTAATFGEGAPGAATRLLGRLGSSLVKIKQLGSLKTAGTVVKVSTKTYAAYRGLSSGVDAFDNVIHHCDQELERLKKTPPNVHGCPSPSANIQIQTTKAQSCMGDVINLGFSAVGLAHATVMAQKLAQNAVQSAARKGLQIPAREISSVKEVAKTTEPLASALQPDFVESNAAKLFMAARQTNEERARYKFKTLDGMFEFTGGFRSGNTSRLPITAQEAEKMGKAFNDEYDNALLALKSAKPEEKKALGKTVSLAAKNLEQFNARKSRLLLNQNAIARAKVKIRPKYDPSKVSATGRAEINQRIQSVINRPAPPYSAAQSYNGLKKYKLGSPEHAEYQKSAQYWDEVTEARVAETLNRFTQVKGFGAKLDVETGRVLSPEELLRFKSTGKPYREFDAFSDEVLVEATSSTTGKTEQIINSYMSRTLNPDRKPVILFADHNSDQGLEKIARDVAERHPDVPFITVSSPTEYIKVLEDLFFGQ